MCVCGCVCMCVIRVRHLVLMLKAWVSCWRECYFKARPHRDSNINVHVCVRETVINWRKATLKESSAHFTH